MIDSLFRLVYFCGYPCARLIRRLTSSSRHGALVAVWYDGRVLLIKNSYRTGWALPGGGIDADEAPIDAAVREMKEELGWTVASMDLQLVASVSYRVHNRDDMITFFRLDLSSLSKIEIDRREVVEARLFTLEDALRLPLMPEVRKFLEGRLTTVEPRPV